MVDWNSPAVLESCTIVTDKINIYVLGFYSWYLVATLQKMEVPLVTGKLRWYWSYLYYLGARYCSLASQLAAIIPKRYINNRGAFAVVATCGSLTTVCATGNLLLRTAAIWRGNRLVLAVLILTGCGHIVTLFVGTLLPFLEDNVQEQLAAPGSILPKSATRVALPFFLYSFILDFVVMVLTIAGLLRHKPARSSSLWLRLYRQGVLYFVCTSVLNLPLLILTSVAITPCLMGVLSSPSLTVTVIASCSAVTSLLDLGTSSDDRVSAEDSEEMRESNRLSTIQVSVSMLHQTGLRDVVQHDSFKLEEPEPNSVFNETCEA